MKMIKLPINSSGSVVIPGTFAHDAVMVGDALLYVVSTGKGVYPNYVPVLDEGDSTPIPNFTDVQAPVVAGVTSRGRQVLVFRSGEQGPGGWTGNSLLMMAVGAQSAFRPSDNSIIVQTTQPGPQGPKGDSGARGATGATGPQGPKGDPGMAVTDQDVSRIAEAVNRFPAAPDHFGIPIPEAQSGLWQQDAITVLLMNQAIMQLNHQASDEADKLSGRKGEVAQSEALARIEAQLTQINARLMRLESGSAPGDKRL